MKKICFINVNGKWGGAEKVLNTVVENSYGLAEHVALLGESGQLSSKLARLLGDDNVSVLQQRDLRDDSGNFFVKNVINFIFNLFKLFIISFEFALQVRKTKAEIVYLNNQQAILLAPLIKLFNPNKVLLGHEHTIQPSSVRQFFYDLVVFLFLEQLITVSKYTKARHFKFAQAKVIQIYNGFKFDKVCTSSLNIPSNKLVVVMPAVFRKWKGHKTLLEAIKIANKSTNNMHYLIVGDEILESEVGIKEDITNFVKDCNIENVQFTGLRQDVVGIIAKYADVVIQPSTMPDPLPTTIIEGLACDKIVVGSEIGGIPEMIFSKKNGFLFPAGDYGALANILAIISELPEQELDQLKLGSKEVFENFFTADRFAAELKKVLREI